MTADVSISCPHCGKVNDIHSPAHGNVSDVPEPGSVSLCILCRCASVFDLTEDDELQLRKPTRNELKLIMSDERILIALDQLSMYNNIDQAIQATRHIINSQLN